jgi:hypothetical protein
VVLRGSIPKPKMSDAMKNQNSHSMIILERRASSQEAAAWLENPDDIFPSFFQAASY